jgi:hypothetical protein
MKQLSCNDPRAQPAPVNQYQENRSIGLSAQRHNQLRAEVEDPGMALSRQGIIDIALGEYFASRYEAEPQMRQ